MKHITKKITVKALTILMTITGFSTILQADPNPFRANHHNQKHVSNSIIFTPDNAFGGVDAQGSYKKRGKIAKIAYDNTTYEFNKVVEDPNPVLHKNKLNLVTLGFFSDHTNSKNMPVTTYVFGSPTNDAAKTAAQAITKAPQAQKPTESDDAVIKSPLIDLQQFKPTKQFAGHDLVGSYDNNTHEAMINDPTGKNNKSYAFSNVQEGLPASQASSSEQPMLIGSYTKAPQCSNGTPQVCSNAIRVVKLYGNLQQ